MLVAVASSNPRVEHALQLARECSAATRSRKSKMSQQRIPLDRLSLGMETACRRRPELIELALDDMPIDVLGEILEADLQLISSRKKVTLEPTTGPRSSSTAAHGR